MAAEVSSRLAPCWSISVFSAVEVSPTVIEIFMRSSVESTTLPSTDSSLTFFSSTIAVDEARSMPIWLIWRTIMIANEMRNAGYPKLTMKMLDMMMRFIIRPSWTMQAMKTE